MVRATAGAMLLGIMMGVSSGVGAAPIAPEHGPGVASIVPIQDWRERCHWLRHEIRDLEDRLAAAPPWERHRLERRLDERRREWRHSCRY